MGAEQKKICTIFEELGIGRKELGLIGITLAGRKPAPWPAVGISYAKLGIILAGQKPAPWPAVGISYAKLDIVSVVHI